MDLITNSTFLITNGLIFALYFFWKFVLYGRGRLRRPLAFVSGTLIVTLILSSLVTLDWKATLISLILLILWTIPANYFLYLLFTKMNPNASSLSYRQFLLNYEIRKKEAEGAQVWEKEFEQILDGDINSTREETNKTEWRLPKAAESIFVSEGIMDNEEQMKLISELSLVTPSIADSVLNNKELFKEFLDWKKQGLPTNVIIHQIHVRLGLM